MGARPQEVLFVWVVPLPLLVATVGARSILTAPSTRRRRPARPCFFFFFFLELTALRLPPPPADVLVAPRLCGRLLAPLSLLAPLLERCFAPPRSSSPSAVLLEVAPLASRWGGAGAGTPALPWARSGAPRQAVCPGGGAGSRGGGDKRSRTLGAPARGGTHGARGTAGSGREGVGTATRSARDARKGAADDGGGTYLGEEAKGARLFRLMQGRRYTWLLVTGYWFGTGLNRSSCQKR